MEGKYMPGAIHSEYWYYNLHLENDEKLKASRFIVEELDLLEKLDEEPKHVYALFPSMKWEDDTVLKDKDFSSIGPSKKMINRFENRYKNYSKDKLHQIKNNNSYRKEAQTAAINLLNTEQVKA